MHRGDKQDYYETNNESSHIKYTVDKTNTAKRAKLGELNVESVSLIRSTISRQTNKYNGALINN